MSRTAVSFAAMSAAEAEIERVTADIRRRLAELDAELASTLPALATEDAGRVRSAQARGDAAVADLCAVLDQLGIALAAARDAGRQPAYVQPVWS